MNRNDGSLHHNRNQRNNKFFPPTTKSRGSAFPTKPFRPRFLSKASRGVHMQTVPGLHRGAQSQHLPWDHSYFSPLLHTLCESRRDPNMWEVKSQRVRARGMGTPAASPPPRRAETDCWCLCRLLRAQVSPSPSFPQALTLQKKHSQTRRLSPTILWAIYTLKERNQFVSRASGQKPGQHR